MRRTDYEDWKAGKKVYKMPWVIRYYQSITDFNQYLLGRKASDRAVTIMTIISFICGLWMGNILWS